MRVQNRSLKGRPLTLLMSVLAATLMPLMAWAQIVPTGGHYAARPSDTGYAGAVNSQGGYGASIPLDLPPAHGGLPLPLHISYGGNKVGAAGQGWDVALSFIRRDTTIAHRRPANVADASPQAREQLSLTLDGQRMDLIRNATNTVWLARRDGAQMEVRQIGGGELTMYDGNGLTYTFSAEGGSAGSRLDSGNLYLLKNIIGPGGNSVHLEYGFGAPALPGGGSGLSINLASVTYNPDRTGACSKHRINLNYDDPVTRPLSISMLGSTVLTRVQKLISVDVTSRATCAAGSSAVSLRKYTFAYQTDADTQRPQLQKVTMIGQSGTPERSVTLPVATYSYGSAADGDGTYNYRLTDIIPRNLTPPIDFAGISGTLGGGMPVLLLTKIGVFSVYGQTAIHNTWQSLIDLNGDGRPDLTYRDGNALRVAYNTASFQGHAASFPTQQLLTDGSAGAPPDGPLEVRTSRIDRSPLAELNPNPSMVWKQVIDVNGDGRPDIIDALEEEGSWVVYLNTPSPNTPRRVQWERRTISIAQLKQRLKEANHKVATDEFHNYLPLAKQTSGRNFALQTCWRWQFDPANPGPFRWVDQGVDGFTGHHCPPQQLFPLTGHTTTEWELSDVNGDGYPDLIYNASPITPFVASNDPPPAPGNPGEYQVSAQALQADFRPEASADIKAMLNVAGVHIGTNAVAFAAPIVLVPDGGLGTFHRCGIERTTVPDVNSSGVGGIADTHMECGFQDVNGDGLVDRLDMDNSPDVNFTTPVARLGTGVSSSPFSSASVALPGLLGFTTSDTTACPDPRQITAPVLFPSRRVSALRDFNGDGIPDFIQGDNALGNNGEVGWLLHMGTGTGFAPGRLINLPGNTSLSTEMVTCDGQSAPRSDTTSGLYDLDGDGRPDVVNLADNFDGGFTLGVHQLSTIPQVDGSNKPQAPISGRLIKVDNGYGAIKTIGYRSAKEDPSTYHLLPFPEVVVTSVGTTDSAGTSCCRRRRMRSAAPA